MSAPKLSVTKNYRLFTRAAGNRPLDLARHKKLHLSMKRYGFLPCFPLGCFYDSERGLIVKDGQHRLAKAEELGLPVYYVVIDVDFDVAEVNDTPKNWTIRDYAETHAASGIEVYREGLDFAEIHGLPVGTAFGLLAGTTTFNNVVEEYKAGVFKVRDRAWADKVGSLYSRIVNICGDVKGASFLGACMAVCRVDEFDPGRFVANALRCREKLVSYSTREAFLEMSEVIYNFGRTKLIPLKTLAAQAMRDRNAISIATKAREEKSTSGRKSPVAAITE